MYVPKIVSESYRDDVRGRMGFSKAELPDDEIMDRIHLAPAEGDVIRAVANWESVQDKDSLYNAVIARVAYYLCDACLQKHKVIVKMGDYETRALPIDWEARKQTYKDQMWGFIGNLVETEDRAYFKVGL